MARKRTVYVCQECGHQTHKWQGQCFECQSFDVLKPKTVGISKQTSSRKDLADKTATMVSLKKIAGSTRPKEPTHLEELDHVLGGGFVPGQVSLISGEPGVGKSTLLLQVAEHFNCFYVCGEESVEQVSRRAKRLGVGPEEIDLIPTVNLEEALGLVRDALNKQRRPLLIVDSIQSVFWPYNDSPQGSITQVQDCSQRVNDLAKKTGLMAVLVGQVTKSGNLAGPRQLEHLVDTVLHLEGDRKGNLRILRSIKNRFGATDEVGIFQMTQKGLSSAARKLEELIEGRQEDAAGSILTVIMEGHRPIILEVQALNTSAEYGNARRVVNGLSHKRVQMLLAVLERRVGIKTRNQDIYINLEGGLKSSDPGLDLPVCLAVASVVRNQGISRQVVAYGEVGLLGEIKQSPFAKRRAKEVKKFGLSTLIDHQYAPTLARVVSKVFG